MKGRNTMQPMEEKDSLQNPLINEVRQKIADAALDAENSSREKYEAKENLIESASDLSTQEKLDAMDRNYDRRNQERWQNVLYFAVASFSLLGIAVVSPVAVKNFRRLLTAA